MKISRGWFITCICLVFVSQAVAADQVKILALEPQSDEEAFLVRRIAEFWKDGDYQIVQSQIQTFLQKYPDSSLKDHLQGILGDLYLQKDQYENALNAYSEITHADVREKTLINKLQCHYELGQYDSIAEYGESYLKHPSASIDERRDEYYFLMAESFFRRSLTTSDPDQKQTLSLKAKPLYEALDQTAYHDISRFALAEIHSTIGDFPEAARTYLDLSEKYTDQREELLFHAGNLQAQYKPEQAVETFSKIIEMNGDRAKEATFNRLLLYYQLGNYDQVVDAHDQVVSFIPDEKRALFDLIVGKSYFSTEDYANALIHLKQYAASTDSATPSLKNALLMLMTASYHQGDAPLFNATFERFKDKFSNDSEMPKAIFTHAMLAKASGDRVGVQEDLETLLKNYPNYEDQEGLLFEYASLTYDHQNWGKSYQSFNDFLTQYPLSERTPVAWRYFFSSALNLFKEAQENEGVHYSKGAFFEDISRVLDQENVLGDDEKREYLLLQAKTAYELDLFDVAYKKLYSYIDTYQQDPSLAEAHFIAGLSSKEINHDLGPVCYHLEKALELDPDFYDTASVHLELYNAYLTLSTLSKEADDFLCKAALHLYDAVTKDPEPIKAENRLWLANYYYNKDDDLAQQRAYYLFKNTLVTDNWESVSINEDSLFLEAEIIKLAKLLDSRGEYQEKISLLKNLAAKQNANPEWDWRFQRRALLELAESYEKTGDRALALNTYSFITETAQYSPSPLSYQALLKEARLRYESLSKKERNESHPEMIAVLNNLKELQIKKHVATEPMHLEAAIDYATIRTELSSEAEKHDRRLFFLKRIKEDFKPTDDQISIDYYNDLQKDAEKNHIFQLYMRLIDAEILQLEALSSVKNGKIETAQEYVYQASKLLEDVQNDSLASPYLQKQVKQTQASLNTMGI